MTTDSFCCINSSFTFTHTPSTQQSTCSVISTRLDWSKQHSLCRYIRFPGKNWGKRPNSFWVTACFAASTHLSPSHPSTHTFYSTEHIFYDICPLDQSNSILIYMVCVGQICPHISTEVDCKSLLLTRAFLQTRDILSQKFVFTSTWWL